MEVVHLDPIDRFSRRHRDAREWLAAWLDVVSRESWKSLQDVRRVYPHADGVPVKGRGTITVFNVRGNKYRLLTRISYRLQVVRIVDVLHHAEYSRNKWKDTL